MGDESRLPGWQCVCEEGDAELVRTMLANHGIQAEIVPIGSRFKYSQMTVWVREADYGRAAALVDQMADAMEDSPIGSWRCGYCGEESEAQFDICWNCGRDRPVQKL
jgi:hypothetical protein